MLGICSQTRHHVLFLLLSQSDLSNTVPLVDAGLLYLQTGMHKKAVNNNPWILLCISALSLP